MNALNPVQLQPIVEAIVEHEPDTTEGEARRRVAELFDLVGIPADGQIIIHTIQRRDETTRGDCHGSGM